MSTKPFAKRTICVMLAAALLAPAAYFICGGVVWYFFYTDYEQDIFEEDGHREFNEDRMEAHGSEGMKTVFATAGWIGVGVECVFCLSLLFVKRSKREEPAD